MQTLIGVFCSQSEVSLAETVAKHLNSKEKPRNIQCLKFYIGVSKIVINTSLTLLLSSGLADFVVFILQPLTDDITISYMHEAPLIGRKFLR